MKIALVRPRYDSHIITPPLGLGYLSSSLKKEGIQTTIFDALKENLDQPTLVKKLVSGKFDAIGITCLTAFYNEVVSLSNELKKHGQKVIVGGVHPTFLPHETLLETKADFIVCGEGEIAFTKLVKSNFKKNMIQGVYSLKNIKKNRLIVKAEAYNNLDDLPFPDWDQMNPNEYPKAPHGAIAKNFPIGIIMTTRGCPYMCSFCASPKFYDRKIRFRSPKKVIEEIKLLKSKFGVKEIHFEDDNLTLQRDHVESICNLLIKNKLNVSWACPNGIRADRVDHELLSLMKKSGCYYTAFGIESANPTILNNIHKLETIDTIQKAITIANKIGIQTQGFFIFGLPGENKKTIQQNIDFAKKSGLARAQFIILDVLPGSELWDKLKGKFKPNWGKKSYKEPEWIPEGLTKEYLMDSQAKAFREFYFRPITFLRLAKSIRLNQLKFLVARVKDYRIVSNKDSNGESTPSINQIFSEIKDDKEFITFMSEIIDKKYAEQVLQETKNAYLNYKSNKINSPLLYDLFKRVDAELWSDKAARKISKLWKN